MLNDMVAAFTASSKIGEAMQKENIKSAKNDEGEAKQEPPQFDDPPLDNFEGEIKNFYQVCPKEMLDRLDNPITLKSVKSFAS